jgi:hypothetical protein
VPTDTDQLVNRALAEIDKTFARIEREKAVKDAGKDVQLMRLKAFQQVLKTYFRGAIGKKEARYYAESALSQLESIQSRLDRNNVGQRARTNLSHPRQSCVKN